MAKTWFLFIGTTPCNPNEYILVGSQPSCPGAMRLCAIFADPDVSGTIPIITQSLCCDIAWSLNNLIESANVLLKT